MEFAECSAKGQVEGEADITAVEKWLEKIAWIWCSVCDKKLYSRILKMKLRNVQQSIESKSKAAFVFLFYALQLVSKTPTTFQANQMQN